MKIEQISIEKVHPYDFNNRKHNERQVERIAKSITEFGFNQPLVLDEDDTILVGHGRLHAAQKLGLQKLPCVKLKGLSDKQKRAYRILDNKLQNDSTWDFDNLGLELGFLEDQGFDLEPWGLGDLLDFGKDREEEEKPPELPSFSYQEQFAVIVICATSTEQEKVYNDLEAQGYKCKVVNT